MERWVWDLDVAEDFEDVEEGFCEGGDLDWVELSEIEEKFEGFSESLGVGGRYWVSRRGFGVDFRMTA